MSTITEHYFAGMGCTCAASGAIDCSCPEVDWTDPEVYALEDKVKHLKELNKGLRRYVSILCNKINKLENNP